MLTLVLLALTIALYFLNKKLHTVTSEVVWKEKYWVTNSRTLMSSVAEACDLTLSKEEAALSIGEFFTKHLDRKPWSGDSLNEYGMMFLVISDMTDSVHIYPNGLAKD